jgi:tetratricopeptide (TPR) repeat protein
MARHAMADAARTRGDLKEAAVQLEYGLTADAQIDNVYGMSRKKIFLADVRRASGDRPSGINSLYKLPELSNPELIFMLGKLFARSGRIGGAEKQVHRLEQSTDKTPRMICLSNMLQSEIAVGQNRPLDAVQSASVAVQHLNSPLAIETLARAYEIAGRRKEAARQYELLLARSNERQFDSADSPALYAVAAAHYHLGVLYQSLRHDDLAVQQFTLLLNYAGEAQHTGPWYEDARKRLAKISSKTASPAVQHRLRTEPIQ